VREQATLRKRGAQRSVKKMMSSDPKARARDAQGARCC